MNTRKLTLTALLTAIALCIFTAEAQLPSLTAIPGIKLGLANVVTVFAMYAAVAHNLGQLAVAIAVMGTTAIGYYLPVLLISGVITGAFTGFCGQFTYARLAKSLQIKPIQ